MKFPSDREPRPPIDNFRAPHQRVRSIAFSNHVGEKLTDRKIAKYIRLGFYGRERMEAALAADRAGKRRRAS